MLFALLLATALVAQRPAKRDDFVDESCASNRGYSTSIVARSVGFGGGSLISFANASSIFNSNFNTAWFPARGAVSEGLVVRLWDGAMHPEWTAAGALAVVPARLSAPPYTTGKVTNASVVWPGVAAPLRSERWGAADPRIAYDPASKQYVLAWDNCTNYCSFRQTQISTSADPHDPASWTHHGIVLDGASKQSHTSGASMLFRGGGSENFAFVAAGAQYNGQAEEVLLIATSASHKPTGWKLRTCKQTPANTCCEDRSNGGTKLTGCKSSGCCSAKPLCLAGLLTPRYCDVVLGGMAGEGCSLHLQCDKPGETIKAIDFADWGQPIATGVDPLNASACSFRSQPNCSLDAKAYVESICVGKASCDISTETLNGLNDPCSGHHKRLAVKTSGCTSPPPTPTPPTPPGRSVLLASRPQCWDSAGICAGPQPERLSDGNYLLLYNHDSHNSSTTWHKNVPVGRCSVGWAVLSSQDPTVVLARGDTPLLTAELPFERVGHTADVVFADGLRPMGNDNFLVIFGAADTDVGAARFKVHVPKLKSDDTSFGDLDAGPPYTLRVEATASPNLVVWELDAFDSSGISMLANCSASDPHLPAAEQRARNCVVDGRAYNSHKIPTLISDDSNWANSSTIRQMKLNLLTDGVVYDKKANIHEFDSQTGESPTRGPELGSFIEFSLSRLTHSATGSAAYKPVRVDLFTSTGAGDNGWHSVTVLDKARNVVSLLTQRGGNGRTTLDGQSPHCKMFAKAADPQGRPIYDKFIFNCSFAIAPHAGAALKVPVHAANWQPLHQTPLPTTQAPALSPEDRAKRLAVFAARDSDAAVQSLADQMFGGNQYGPDPTAEQGLLLRSASTAVSYAAYAKHDYRGALDTWQTSFFKQLLPRNIHYSYNPSLTQCCSYTMAADDLLANFSVTFGSEDVESSVPVSLARYEVGAIHWLGFAKNLAGVQELSGVSASWKSLLFAFNRSAATGAPNAEYIKRWAALIDDWTLNYFEDTSTACSAGVNAKNMFVMIEANYHANLLELLSDVEQFAHVSKVMPSTTMARLMLKLNAEYLPAYWRVARGTLFNHDTSGLAANYITARMISQFLSGRTLMREIRDHIGRWMAWGETAYGSMIEIDDEGHFAMPLDNLGVVMDQFD